MLHLLNDQFRGKVTAPQGWSDCELCIVRPRAEIAVRMTGVATLGDKERLTSLSQRHRRTGGAGGDDRHGIQVQLAIAEATLDGEYQAIGGRGREGDCVGTVLLPLRDGGNRTEIALRAAHFQPRVKPVQERAAVLPDLEFERVLPTGDDVL